MAPGNRSTGKRENRRHRGTGSAGKRENRVDFKMKTIEVDGIKVRIQIWDTAGQERYQTITKQYYRRAQGIFLVYDIGSERSYQHIVKWASDVDEYAPDGVQKILIGNKADEEHKSWPGSTGWTSTRPAPAATSTSRRRTARSWRGCGAPPAPPPWPAWRKRSSSPPAARTAPEPAGVEARALPLPDPPTPQPGFWRGGGGARWVQPRGREGTAVGSLGTPPRGWGGGGGAGRRCGGCPPPWHPCGGCVCVWGGCCGCSVPTLCPRDIHTPPCPPPRPSFTHTRFAE
ncbi:ras-related protein Rab-15 isoform X2 [Larus michahellis]|uniref:ras-related protein Rab-15 isoform X2 n=1 Tax=Larus michahellis TaxID=119627 RepID=UPI003D9AD0B3